MRNQVNAGQILTTAVDLLSDDGENEEYDRAIIELVRDLLGLDWEDETREFVTVILRGMKR